MFLPQVNEELFDADANRIERRILEDIRSLGAGTKLVAVVEADFQKVETASYQSHHPLV